MLEVVAAIDLQNPLNLAERKRAFEDIKSMCSKYGNFTHVQVQNFYNSKHFLGCRTLF